PRGYRIISAINVPAIGGAERVDLLEDERLDADTRRTLDSLYSLGGRPCIDQPFPQHLASLCASVARTPLRYVVVRLTRVHGAEVGRLTLERATAELTRLAVSRSDSVFA